MPVALEFIDLEEREGLYELSGLLLVKDIRHANLVEFRAWVKTEDGHLLDLGEMAPGEASIEIGDTPPFEVPSPTRPIELIVATEIGSKTLIQRLQEVNQGREAKDWIGLPEDELLDSMEHAARGIDYLNEHGIVHGDIKPHNLLIVGDSVKVCGLGLTRKASNLRETQSGMGTVAYAAPELFEGKPQIQSDQYCLAISYTELRTGALPFDETNPFKVIELHRHEKLNFQRLTGRERDVIKRATAFEPERRWSSCSEMVRKLRESRHPDRSAKGILGSLLARFKRSGVAP